MKKDPKISEIVPFNKIELKAKRRKRELRKQLAQKTSAEIIAEQRDALIESFCEDGRWPGYLAASPLVVGIYFEVAWANPRNQFRTMRINFGYDAPPTWSVEQMLNERLYILQKLALHDVTIMDHEEFGDYLADFGSLTNQFPPPTDRPSKHIHFFANMGAQAEPEPETPEAS